jgi:exosortase
MPVSLLAAAAAGLVLYASTIAGLVRDWMTASSALSGVLLVGCAVLVTARRWRNLIEAPLAPSRMGVPCVVVAMTAYLLGTLSGDEFILRASLPVALCGVVLMLGGRAQLRLLCGPLLLIALAIPLPAVIVTRLTLPMQLVASQLAAATLHAAHVPVTRYGNLLVLDRAVLEVASACSGMQSVMALLAVTAVALTVAPLAAWRRALLLGAVVPVAIVVNGVRIAFTGALTRWIGEAAVNAPVHDLTGLAGFFVMCGVLFAVMRVTRRSDVAPSVLQAAS